MLIISPEYPPVRGGVSDHTARLARELSTHHRVKVLTRPGSYYSDDYEVQAKVTDWKDGAALKRAIEGACPEGPLLWQYVPHMYGWGGVNQVVPRVMAAMLQKGRHQVVIAHEIAAPFSPWPHRFLYALAHRRQWLEIIHWADVVGISTEAWVEEWSARVPSCAKKLHLLPSPASVPVENLPPDHRERWRARRKLPPQTRVMAYFGALNSAKQFAWVTAAWRQAQNDSAPVALAVIGGKPTLKIPKDMKALYCPLGYQRVEEVSATLQAADLMALPFLDGASERRTSFMAGLSHGCPVVTTVGANTGPALRQARYFASAPANDRAAFVQLVTLFLNDEGRRAELGQGGRAAYERFYSWPVVVGKLDAWLKDRQATAVS